MIQDLKTLDGIQLLLNNYVGYLAYIDQSRPFIVPITYAYDRSNNAIISYAAEGQKIRAMRKNKDVAMEVTEIDTISSWRSVLLHGTFEELQSIDARYHLRQFANTVKSNIRKREKKHLQYIREFSSKLDSGQIPIVYRINIYEMTAKCRAD